MYGTVADFLRDKISDGSSLSIVSAYFTIYAFNKLRDALAGIKKPHFSLDVSADGNLEEIPSFNVALVDESDSQYRTYGF